MQAERFAVIGYQQQRRRGDVFIASPAMVAGTPFAI
jgi:hypothetical protein